MNGTVVDLEVDTRLDERPHVGAVEGVEIAGADLDSPSTQVTPFIFFCHSRRLENKFGRNEEDMINTSLNELQWNNVPIATHELMAKVDADLGNVVVAGEDERSHEIVAAVAAGLEARNLENISFHTNSPNSQSQSLIQIVS